MGLDPNIRFPLNIKSSFGASPKKTRTSGFWYPCRERSRMLGRVRASSSNSLQELEMERLPSKHIKHDSLSIYERTLMKLKHGSQHALDLPPIEEETTTTYTTPLDSIAEEAAKSSSPSTTDSKDSTSMDASTEQHHKRTLSVLDMFSRYRTSQHAQS